VLGVSCLLIEDGENKIESIYWRWKKFNSSETILCPWKKLDALRMSLQLMDFSNIHLNNLCILIYQMKQKTNENWHSTIYVINVELYLTKTETNMCVISYSITEFYICIKKELWIVKFCVCVFAYRTCIGVKLIFTILF